MVRFCLPLLFLITSTANADEPASLPTGYKLLYSQTFDTPESLKDLVVRDPKVWKHAKTDGGGSLELAYKNYKDPSPAKYRSPFHIALIADKIFTDFAMDLEVQSTIAPYGHQDLCLFFGYENPEHFYYAHMAVKTDDHAHNVFIVNDAPRLKISKETTPGITWGVKTWHKVRLVREGSIGKVEVYFDDMTKPIMRAEDKTFSKGWVGFGSFDDVGLIRNVKIYGPSMEEKRNPFLKAISGN